MTWVVRRLGIFISIVFISLVSLVSQLESNGQTIVAFVYSEADGRYFILTDTTRNITHRIQQPVETLRGVVFSPDGRRALIPYGETSQLLRLAIYDLPTQTVFTNPSSYDTCAPSYDGVLWSPDSSRVVFDCRATAANPQSSGLHMMDFESRQTMQINDSPLTDLTLWSPDAQALMLNGTQVLSFPDMQRRNLPSGVWLAHWMPDSSRLILVIEDDILFDDGEIISEDLSVSPRFFEVSPDGRYLAFVAEQRGLFRLYVVDLITMQRIPIDGGDLKINGVQGGVWSPDSTWIAITTSNDSGSRNLYVVKPDDSQAILVSADGTLPAWSGHQLAYLQLNSATITGDQLMVVEIPSLTVQLTSDDALDGIWSSEGIVYVQRLFAAAATSRLSINNRALLESSIINFAIWEQHHD